MNNNINNAQKAEIIAHALPHIQKYRKKTVVVKYGGNAMTNEELKQAVMSDIVLLSLVGVMVGEIVQKHLPQMTACRRKKPLKKPRGKSPLYRIFTSPIRQKAVSEMAQLFAAFFGRSGTFRSVRKP